MLLFTHSNPIHSSHTCLSPATGEPSEGIAPGREERYKKVISKLKRQAEADTTKIRSLKTALTSHKEQRNDLQGFLKKCIGDVRLDISNR